MVLIPKEDAPAYERVDFGKLGDGRGAGRKGGRTAQPSGVENELERMAAKAKEAGYAAGYREGSAKAAAEAQRLNALAEEAHKALALHGEEIAAEVLNLALELARQMLCTELKVRRETLIAVVREALDCLPHGTQGAQLLINPVDIEVVRSHVGEDLKATGLRVVEDHRIQPGGCKITSSVCEVDATLATRWKRIVATLGLNHNWLDLE
jgi:flagellar assembly protein FliH